MTGPDFIRWRKHLGLSQIAAARALDMSPAGLRKLEKGKTPIRKIIRLACAALALGIQDYNGPESPDSPEHS